MSNLTNTLRGKTVEWVATDGERLIIRTTNGQEHRIVWDGEPVLEGVDVKVVMPSPCDPQKMNGSIQ